MGVMIVAGKPTVTLTLAGDESKLTSAFDSVGAASKRMTDQVNSASSNMRDAGSGFDRLAESTDTAETRFTGFYDTIGGTRDALAALNDDSLSASDRLVALGMAGADLAGGLTGFVVPAIQSMWTKLVGSTAATWALTTAQTAWTAITRGAAIAMQFLNTAMRANPIMFVVGLVSVLVLAFLALWRRSEGFRNFFIGMWNGIKSTVGAVVDWVKGAWNGVADFFANFPDRIGKALGAIGGVFKSAFKGAVNIAIDVINWFIDRANDLIYGINLVNPFEDIPDIPKLSRMHTGGVVPGMPGQEVPMLLQAGERVSTSSQGGGGGALWISGNADSALASFLMSLERKGIIRWQGA